MNLSSDNFKHLDPITTEFTLNGLNYSPSLLWTDPLSYGNGYLIMMVNSKTKNIHWATMANKDKSSLGVNEKTGYESVNYTGPNDKNDIVAYTITIYSLINPELQFQKIIEKDNVVDSAYIKFIYNGF